jgi:DUF438 domain-containing protein
MTPDETPDSHSPLNADGTPEAGSLSPAQAELVIRHLCMNVSLTDEHGTLVFWHGPIFDDCDGAFIGRHVDDCHAPQSRDAIARMIATFRAGAKDEESFWYVEDGRQLLARYAAVRDRDGTYCGLLETVQDVTDLRKLEGKGNTLDMAK